MEKDLTIFSIILTLFAGCSQNIPAPGEIKLSWEVVSNEYAEKPKAKATFSLENNSRFTFTDRNWKLFFSQMPRKPLTASSNVEIEHISGDWFVMKPVENFRLKPGESLEIITEHSDWVIKETDAPLGPYFVFYDRKGKETEIVPVTDYTILPFTRSEQINRHRNDKELIPTAAWNYQNNESLSLLPNDELLPFIPSPVSYKATGKKVIFDSPVRILHEKGLENEARFITGFLEKMTGSPFEMAEASAPEPESIFLNLSDLAVYGKSHEAYRLEIKSNQSVTITGSDPAGIFYGLQSLIGLLPVEIFRGINAGIALDEVVIEDAPRFEYRSLHIDVARNFQTKETIKSVIDILSFYKGNYLLLYLTEDEGWRLEIEELPELTAVGAQRGHTTKDAPAMHPSYGSGPEPYAEDKHGSGYYSREDFIEILRYAQSKHVTIIPEVNFPGHSRAAIKAMEARYHKFMEMGDEVKANEFRLIDPEDTSTYLSAQWYTDNIVNVARESVYKFYETVVDDIIEMYDEAGVELEYFHTGGDEVPEGAWTGSPMCAELLETMPDVTDPKNLQAYFFRRAVEMLQRKNLKIGGWEEVALLKDENGAYIPNDAFVDKDVYPYVWNNLGDNTDLAYRLANSGYPVILCNVSNFYFDLAYDKDPREPGHYWAGFVKTRDAWQVAPFNMFYTTTQTSMGRDIDIETEYAGMERIKPEAEKNIIGLEAHLWSETIKGSDMLEHYLLPRLVGFAETAWTAERRWENMPHRAERERVMDEEWNRFANTLAQRELPRLAGIFGGYNYRVSTPGAIVEEGELFANTSYPGLTLRYTTDGSEPDRNSPVYEGPVSVDGPVTLKAFDAAGNGGLTTETE